MNRKSLSRPTLGFLFTLMTLLAGCDSPTDSNSNNTPTVQAEDIQKAQRKAILKLDSTNIQKGHSAYFTETQEIVTSEGPITNLVSEWTTEVTDTEVLDGYLILTTMRTLIDHNEPGKPVFKFQDVLAFELISEETKKAIRETALSVKLMERSASQKSTKDREILSVTFRNLKTKDVVLTPPERVIKSEDCRGLSPCEIHANRITYEVTFALSDGTEQKHQIEWHLSPDVPFFASVLKQCATTVASIENLRVLVKQCQNVVDFNF